MPVFISYSRADRHFVDRLAMQLVMRKVSVWLDRWELNVGDSLISRIQEAITGASGLLVILSKASVTSAWCVKELNAGLIRELEEQRVVVLPVLIEDCDVPLFLRDKLYADLRTDFDDGLQTILESLAKVTNEWQGRLEHADYHTDWAIDWGTTGNDSVFRLTMVEHAKSLPFTILATVTVMMHSDTQEWYREQESLGHGERVRSDIVRSLFDHIANRGDFVLRLKDQLEVARVLSFEHAGHSFGAIASARRLGIDTGRDIVFRLHDHIGGVANSMNAILKEAPASSKTRPNRTATKKTRASRTVSKRSTGATNTTPKKP